MRIVKPRLSKKRGVVQDTVHVRQYQSHGLGRGQKGLVCCSVDQSPLQLNVSFAFPSEIKASDSQGLSCLRSIVRRLLSLMVLGKHIVYWCWYTKFYQAQGQRSCLPADFWAHRASFCWPVLWRCGFPFPAPAHTAKRPNSCFKDQGIPELEGSPDGAHSTPQDLDQGVYLKRGKPLCTNTAVKCSGDFFFAESVLPRRGNFLFLWHVCDQGEISEKA